MDDELYPEAKQLVQQNGWVTITWLQRRMRIGYCRAGRLVEAMLQEGVIEAAFDKPGYNVVQLLAVAPLQVCTVTTWAYIHSQLDRGKQYRVHIYDASERKALCGLRGAYDDIGEMKVAEYLDSPYACVRCRRIHLSRKGGRGGG